ncbi:hypothetical protein OKA05_04855 [Luteolibacter arcticus]|uniref:Uncharacterized protein n=1 Tax=Luteolibacter arcticus TaxID=1581411 RepID=A0ABT3GE18_9BACT|nr:hypothetical protein [Luteolibacter arcticus]MCW1921869.1 hypothetical protein [Luteolibacter arcticus]
MKIEVEKTPEAGIIYRTEHFEIVSDAELAPPAAKEVAGTFEAIHRLLAASPWGILANPAGGRFRIELHADPDAYLKAGGPSDRPGIYIASRKVFIAPLESFGLEKSPKGWQRREDIDTSALTRALTPMMMNDALAGLPMWLIEGAAGYMELMPVKGGTFSPAGHLKNVQQRAGEIEAYPLARVFTMDRPTWDSGDKDAPAAKDPSNSTVFGNRSLLPRINHTGMLITWYFIHAEGDGDAVLLRKFIAACRENARVVEDHRKALAAYDKAFAEFIRHPEVEKSPDGSYSYPKTLAPPKSPAFPFDCAPEQVAFKDIGILLNGRSPEALATAMRDALVAKKIPLPSK